MTYEENIMQLIKQIRHIYNAAEPLRDCAFRDQQKYWNEIRRVFYNADAPLCKLLHDLTAGEAKSEISDYATLPPKP